MWDLIVSVPDHRLSFYFSYALKLTYIDKIAGISLDFLQFGKLISFVLLMRN